MISDAYWYLLNVLYLVQKVVHRLVKKVVQYCTIFNAAKLCGATGAMALLVFWSWSLKSLEI